MQRNMLSPSENSLRHRSSLKEEKKMEKSITRNCSGKLWFAILISFTVLISSLVCFDYSTFFDYPNNVLTLLLTKQENPFVIISNKHPDSDSCSSRYIYIHHLPSRFNNDFIKKYEVLTEGRDKLPNMCPYLENFGLGPELENSEGAWSNSSWYATYQFSLEVIFHNRMKRYDCLTKDSSLASAIFVPYYAGLDVSGFLEEPNQKVRDSSGRNLLQWLASKPEWKRMWGRDHFLVPGRAAWDFRRQSDNGSLWGSKFRFLPESMNMSILTVEASSWVNDYTIPYPTSFHPSKDSEILQWQSKIRQQKRPYLFTFTDVARTQHEDSIIRGKIIDHCQGSRFCRFIDCSYGGENCYNPINVMKELQNSVFCLQPSSDSYTRKSTFDFILAGCIPVFFNPFSAYSQYLWHLPKNRTKYSVYIPVRDVKEWKPNVEKILHGFSEHEVLAMREEVIKLIPRIIYAHPMAKLETFEDAFDIAVKRMLEMIERVREVIKNGSDPSVGFADEETY